MYTDFFALQEPPFSIVPNARYFYLSARHQEAITHLQAGLGSGGGFALLTGEVGTGKTTVAKALLAQLGDKMQTALLLNPTFSSGELLEAICDAFAIDYPERASLKQLHHAIHQFLLAADRQGLQTLIVIDEAQHLAAEVLEQLRLLTNLETEQHKLLKVVLVGQPELQDLLRTTALRQLAQRITARYHLLPLDAQETEDYIAFRLQQAGRRAELFDRKMSQQIAKYSHGIPRLINLICEGVLLSAYRRGEKKLSLEQVKQACVTVMAGQADIYHLSRATSSNALRTRQWIKRTAVAGAVAVALGAVSMSTMMPQWLFDIEPVSGELTTLSATVTDDVIETSAKLVMTDSPATPSVPSQSATDSPSFDTRHESVAPLFTNNQNAELAIKQLYGLWGFAATVQERLCLSESSSTFVCQRVPTTWAQLIEHNRPVVLALYQQGEVTPHYVVLYRIDSEHATVLTPTQALRLPSTQLQAYWQGEAIEIWSAPLTQTLKPGMQGSDIAHLDRLLAHALGEAPLESAHFDAQLTARVELFQRWQKMGVDGIAGERTLRRLQRLVQPTAPNLLYIVTQDGARSALVDGELNDVESLPLPEFGELVRAPQRDILTTPNDAASVLAPSAERLEQASSAESKPFVIAANDSQEASLPSLNDLDLSSLSPELVARLENARVFDEPSELEDASHTASEENNHGAVIELERQAAQWQGRLPPLNLQTHLYAGDPSKRWVKINGREYRQQEWISSQLQLVEIQPQRVVIVFDGVKISLPALYEWQG